MTLVLGERALRTTLRPNRTAEKPTAQSLDRYHHPARQRSDRKLTLVMHSQRCVAGNPRLFEAMDRHSIKCAQDSISWPKECISSSTLASTRGGICGNSSPEMNKYSAVLHNHGRTATSSSSDHSSVACGQIALLHLYILKPLLVHHASTTLKAKSGESAQSSKRQ